MINNLIKLIVIGLFSLNSLAANNSILAILDKNVITTNDIREAVQKYQKNNDNPADKALLVKLLNIKIDTELQKQYAQKNNIQIRTEMLQQRIATLAKQNKLSLTQFRKLPHYDEIVEQLRDQSITNGLRNIITQQIKEVSKTLIDKAYQTELAKQNQYQVANIVLNNQDQAYQLVNKLKQNSHLFAQIASESSLAVTADNAGNLGYNHLHNLPELYQNVAANLSIGQVSDVISQKDKDIYHIIKLTNIKQATDLLTTQVKINHIFIAKDSESSQTPTIISTSKTILNIYQQLKNGANFADLAQKYSQGDYAKEGGELPWINIIKLPKNGRLNFNNLDDNEISPPFTSKFGWHIIQKIGSKKISTIKQNLRQKILKQMKLKFYQNWLKQQREQTFIVIYENKLDLLLEELKP